MNNLPFNTLGHVSSVIVLSVFDVSLSQVNQVTCNISALWLQEEVGIKLGQMINLHISASGVSTVSCNCGLHSLRDFCYMFYEDYKLSSKG